MVVSWRGGPHREHLSRRKIHRVRAESVLPQTFHSCFLRPLFQPGETLNIWRANGGQASNASPWVLTREVSTFVMCLASQTVSQDVEKHMLPGTAKFVGMGVSGHHPWPSSPTTVFFTPPVWTSVPIASLASHVKVTKNISQNPRSLCPPLIRHF